MVPLEGDKDVKQFATIEIFRVNILVLVSINFNKSCNILPQAFFLRIRATELVHTPKNSCYTQGSVVQNIHSGCQNISKNNL